MSDYVTEEEGFEGSHPDQLNPGIVKEREPETHKKWKTVDEVFEWTDTIHCWERMNEDETGESAPDEHRNVEGHLGSRPLSYLTKSITDLLTKQSDFEDKRFPFRLCQYQIEPE